MLSSTLQLGPASEILSEAKDDKRRELLTLVNAYWNPLSHLPDSRTLLGVLINPLHSQNLRNFHLYHRLTLPTPRICARYRFPVSLPSQDQAD